MPLVLEVQTFFFSNFAAKERRTLAASQLDNHCGSSAKAKNVQTA